MIGCRGVVELGGPDSWYSRGGPAKVGACKLLPFTENSLVVKIKNTWLILLSHLTKPFHFKIMPFPAKERIL